MVRLVIVVFATVLMIVSGCSNTISLDDMRQGSSGDAVFIGITKNGIMADASEVIINNFYPGAKAEITYRIHNGTTAAIRPEIYLVDYADITDYSQSDGAVKAPAEVAGWLDIPNLGEVKQGEIEDFTVIIKMPKGIKDIPNKFGLQVQVSGNNGGIIQTAIGTWWIVNMR